MKPMYEWDCPNCGERISTAVLPPKWERPLDVERLAEALNRHSARNSIDGHDWNSCEASCAPLIAAEYSKL